MIEKEGDKEQLEWYFQQILDRAKLKEMEEKDGR